MSPVRVAFALAGTVIFAVPAGASAETFRLVSPDGTVHYTNAPTDPSYRRMGLSPPRRADVPRIAIEETYSVERHVREASARYGVPEKLVTAVIRAESNFNPRAVSPKGARGLMQLMPQTASLLGVIDSFDPAQNIDGGVRHLRGLIERFPDNLPLALAAYNAGAQAVTQYRGIPPYPETMGYVRKVLGFFNGGTATTVALTPVVYPTRRYVTEDGTILYSNLPPAEAARLVGR